MKKNEQDLFKSLCSFQAATFDRTLLDAATPTVLGQLFYSRMQAVAYGVLEHHGLLGMVNREFKNALQNSYIQNLEKNNSFFCALQELNETLSACPAPYAMLKGACLCRLYPQGYRTANDIDLLLLPQDVSCIGQALQKAGFRQGYIRNGRFVPASRQEIIASKMMRGETVPYIKEVNLPSMPFLEVDINFSLDYKPDEASTVSEMLKHADLREVRSLKIRTLREDDFFLHLCCHLYKEATTLPWIDMKRDMTLYKYCDIYMLLNHVSPDQVHALFNRAATLGLESICAFAILQTGALFQFENIYALALAKDILKADPDFLHRVVAPREGKSYLYTEKDLLKRLWSTNRKDLLREEASK